MNMDSESHDPGRQPQGPPPPNPGGANGFFRWLRGLDIQRSANERWFAGVAGGIASKAGIDPLIVRGIFVVLAILGGPGILLYLAGWLLLPDHSDKIHVEELVRGRATPGVIVAIVLLGVWFVGSIIAGVNFPGLHWNVWGVMGMPWWLRSTFTWLFWIAVLAGVAFLIHRIVLQHGRNQQAASPGGEAPAQAASNPTDSSATESFAQGMAGASDAVADKAKAWSAQYAEQHERRKLGAAHFLITAALALIAAGGAALWVDYAGLGGSAAQASLSGATLIAALAAATAVLALSMIIAGLRGKNAGGVGFLGLVGIAALTVSAVLPAGTTYHLLGNNTVSHAAPASFAVVGDTDLDLAIYDSDPGQTQVDITQVVGDVNLQLSQTRPTELTMDVVAGNIEGHGLDWRKQSGVLNRRTVVVNETAPGPTLHVHVRLVAGTIVVNQQP